MKHKIWNIIGIIAVCVAIVFAVFLTKEKVMQVGIKQENMDWSVKPGDDFYDYATRGWRKNNPLPNDYTRFGSFEMVDKMNEERVHEMIKDDNGRVGTLYKIFMDTEKLNAEKTEPVKPYLAEIDNIKTREDLAIYLGKNQKYECILG